MASLLLAESSAVEIDSDTIALYCQAAGEFESLADCLTTCKATWVQHPKVALRSRAFERMLKLAKELGLTPKSRAGLPKNPTPVVDEFSILESDEY